MAMLGAPHFARDGQPLAGFISIKAKALLCFLAVTGRAQRRDTLLGLFWGEKPESDARLSLRVALANLRRLTGDHVAATRESAVFHAAQGDLIDVAQFETGARFQRSALTDDEANALARADALYLGDFLEGFFVRDAPAFEEWVIAQRTRLRNLELQVLYLLAAYHAQRQAYTQAIAYAQRSLQLEPWQEECHYRLMQWYFASGQRSLALAQYEICRRMLAAEFNTAPSESTTALYRQLRAA
jgi:DNA-binding SARP family transcriptional activator